MDKNDKNLDDFVIPVATSQIPQSPETQELQHLQNEKAKKRLEKKGCMIAGVICTIIAFIMTIVTVFVYLYIFLGTNTGSQSLNGFVTALLFFLYFGWFTYLPALLLAIVGIVFSAVGIQSTIKKIKTTCKVFTVLSSIILVILLALFVISGVISTPHLT